MKIEKIFENNKIWVADKLKGDSNYFKTLSKGQNPDILYIGCSDSRVAIEKIIGAEPGDIFVHRNIANIVSPIDLSAMSVVEYAVSVLKVKHILLVGHYQCGGVKVGMSSDNYGVLNPWIDNIRDVYLTHQTELELIKDEERRYDKLVELNVKKQCDNLLKIPVVKNSIANKELQVHGWVWDIYTGQMVDMVV